MAKFALLVLSCLFCNLIFAQKNDVASGKTSQVGVAQPNNNNEDQHLHIYRCLSGRLLDPDPQIGPLKTSNSADINTEFSTIRVMTEKGFTKGKMGSKDPFKAITDPQEKKLSLDAAKQRVQDLRPIDTKKDVLFYLETKQEKAGNTPGSQYLSLQELQKLASGFCSCEKINGINLESLDSAKRALSRNQEIQVKDINAEPRVLSYSELGCK